LDWVKQKFKKSHQKNEDAYAFHISSYFKAEFGKNLSPGKILIILP